MRRAVIAILTGLLMLGLAGCISPFQNACPAIAWISGLTVDATAYGPDVFVQLCTDAGCSAAPGEQPTPSTDFATPEGDGTTFSFGMSAPDTVTALVYDGAGLLLSESEQTIDWTHSTDPCGGPSTAPPLVLQP